MEEEKVKWEKKNENEKGYKNLLLLRPYSSSPGPFPFRSTLERKKASEVKKKKRLDRGTYSKRSDI